MISSYLSTQLNYGSKEKAGDEKGEGSKYSFMGNGCMFLTVESRISSVFLTEGSLCPSEVKPCSGIQTQASQLLADFLQVSVQGSVRKQDYLETIKMKRNCF